MSHFSIFQCPVGQKQNFSYLLCDFATKQAAVVDPAWEFQKILTLAHSKELTITHILLTHSHNDHVNGLEEALNFCTTAQVYLSKAEADFWQKSKDFPVITQNDEECIHLGETKIQSFCTPGHTIGSVCYSVENNVITGDTLFIPRCGRCDLPSGNAEQMFYSLQRIKQTFSPHTRIYPGHDYGDFSSATLAELLICNSSLQFDKCSDFIKYRMG
jgi:hydroxyacylglutathione hydrolase